MVAILFGVALAVVGTYVTTHKNAARRAKNRGLLVMILGLAFAASVAGFEAFGP